MVATQQPAGDDVIEAGYAEGLTDPGAAAAWCERYARAHSENFTVVSWFLPQRLAGPMFSIYAFCRFTDDLGDEAEGDRLALLDEWERDLERGFAGTGRHPIHMALGELAKSAPLRIEHFRKLIEANRIDQRRSRYETFRDVLDYCEHSANPVGRMVLAVWGYDDDYRGALSDGTCTALQLANHWQDVGRDYEAGRIYLPQDELRSFGVTESQIAERRCDDNFRALMRFQVDRAEVYFRHGDALLETVDRELAVDLKLFSDGGRSVLRAIERQGYDVLRHRPTVSRGRKGWMALRAAAALRLGLR